MVTIKCVNPKCGKSFKWDETEYGEKIARPHEEDARRVIAICPYCNTDNVVWVKKAKKAPVYRE